MKTQHTSGVPVTVADLGRDSRPQAAGDLLRHWRSRRGLSQLALALQSGTSQRHLSFVESGRSIPSRGLLLRLAETMTMPLRERNALLLAAGYAPMYAEASLDEDSMQVVTLALDRMLQNHEPHPAFVMDRYWNVIRANTAAPALFGSLIDLERFPKPRNLLELTFDPEGLRPHIEDWERVAAGLLERVRREALGSFVDAGLQAVLKKILAYPGAANLPVSVAAESPVLPITFRRGSERISYFSLVTTVGTPQTVAAQELRLECMFPVELPLRPTVR